MNAMRILQIWLLLAMIGLSASGAVKANIASGLHNFSVEVPQAKSAAKPLKPQGKTECSMTGVSDLSIEEDKETGLLYAKARFYDPDTGKFLSEDAWAGDQLIAPSLHKYLYAYQNPTVWIDPTGHAPVDNKFVDDAGRTYYGHDAPSLKEQAKKRRAQEALASEQAALKEQQAQAAAREQAIRQKNLEQVSDKQRQAAAKQEAINREIVERNKDTRQFNKEFANSEELPLSKWQVRKKETIVTESERGVTPQVDNSEFLRREYLGSGSGQDRLAKLNKEGVKASERLQEGAELLTPIPAVAPLVGVKIVGKGFKLGQKGSKELGQFADAEKLTSHFTKHGAAFGAKNADEYLSIAQNVMKNGTKVSYNYKGEVRTGFVQLMGTNRKGQSKFAFVGTNNEGNITTLHAKSGKDFWKTLNGNAKDKVIRPN